MKKHSKLTIGLTVALCIMICICAAAAITLAKYISSVTATDSAPVAKWEWQINDISVNSPGEQTLEIDLFDTIYDEDTESEEEHVVDSLLAPGTGGSFEITIKNLSQVDALLTMKVIEQNEAGIPIQYSLDKETWFDDIFDCKLNLHKSFFEMLTGSVSRTVYWRWCFEGGDGAHKGQSDATDNALLADPDNLPVLQIDVSILAEQYYEVPVLAAGNTWYSQGGTKVAKSSIKTVTFVDSIEDFDMGSNTIVDQWDASNAYSEDTDYDNGPVTAYALSDNTLVIAGNGHGYVYANPDSSNVFNGFGVLETVSGGNLLNTSMATTFERMFQACFELKSVDVSTWDTSSVTSLKAMFQGAMSIANLDVSNWETGNVLDMTSFLGMPADAYTNTSLTYLDVSNWDTGKLTTLNSAFLRCSALRELDVSDWNTSSLTNLYATFCACNALEDLDVSKWDTSNVETMVMSFGDCFALSTLDVSNWDVSRVASMQAMFQNCTSINGLDVSNWCPSACESMQNMFYHCTSLTELDVANWDVSKVKTFSGMFCGNDNAGDMKLKNLDVSKWQTPSATNMQHMFYGCAQLTELDLSSWETSQVSATSHMFADCLKLSSINFDGWNTEMLKTVNGMFNDCRSLVTLDISDFNTQEVTDFGQLFENCSSLKTIYVSGAWSTAKATTSGEMFTGCNNLVGGAGTVYNSSFVDISRAKIDGGSENPGYLTDIADKP